MAVPEALAQRRRGKQKPLPPPVAAPKLICRLATGPGMGKIPQYVAAFYRPGKLVYTGRRFTPITGTYEYVLPDILIKNLLLDAKATKLMALPTPSAGPPDIPTDTLYLWLEGKERTFIFNVITGPEILVTYAKKLRGDVAAIVEEQEPSLPPASAKSGTQK